VAVTTSRYVTPLDILELLDNVVKEGYTKTISLKIPESLYIALKLVADASNVTASEIIRRALMDYIRRYAMSKLSRPKRVRLES